MRKYLYLFAAFCILAGAVLPATAGPGCEKHEKACTKKVEAIALSADELEDGKVIEVGDGTLTMKQDGDAWTFTYTGEEGEENSVFTIALDGDEGEPQVVKIITTSDGSDTWTEVTTGEEHHLEGGHHAIFISEGDPPVMGPPRQTLRCCHGQGQERDLQAVRDRPQRPGLHLQ